MVGKPPRIRMAYMTAALAAALVLILVVVNQPNRRGLSRAVEFPVLVDPAVELFSIIHRLAGTGQYDEMQLPDYIQEVWEHFGPFRDHEAVALVREMNLRHGINGNAPMDLAVHLTPPPGLELRAPLPLVLGDLDSRWSADLVLPLLEAVRTFAEETDFAAFFEAHAPFYSHAVESLRSSLAGTQMLPWLQEFFGRAPEGYVVVLGLLNGTCNYGSRVTHPDGDQTFVSMLGALDPGRDDVPRYSRDRFSRTIVHEFAHSYVNPLVDRNREALAPAGEALFARIRDVLRPWGYTEWYVMVYEYLVRASTLRYLQACQGVRAARSAARGDREVGFVGIQALADLLAEYESDRATYPDLDAFLPRLAAFFRGQTESNGIVGSWTGGQLLEYARPDSQVITFSRRPDGSVCLSAIYEVGPRARLWSYDIDVSYHNGMVSWAYHEGHLSPDGDTLRVSKDYRGDRSEWLWVRDRGADSLMERLQSQHEMPYEYIVPPQQDDGWVCAGPDGVGLDRVVLLRFLARITSGDFGDIHSVLVVRHGTLVVEEYFAEGGTKHGPFVSSLFRNRLHHLASVSKPVTSALVGIAMEGGYVSSVQDPVSRYLEKHAALFSDGREAITLEHLLTMSSGLRREAASLMDCRDVVGCVLGQPLIARPGSRFAYSNGAAAVMGVVLENATGMELRRFAEDALFAPLGITDYLWTSYPDGTTEADGGLALKPRDLAKIGQSFLDQGRWQGKQVIPADWVRQSTTMRLTFGAKANAPLGYGYFWMQTELPTPEGEVSAYFHPGDGEQLLMVIPGLDMVVVFTGGTYGTDVTRKYLALLTDEVLPAVDLSTQRPAR